MRVNNLDDKKRTFKLVNEFSNAIFLKSEISSVQSDFIVHVIIKFKLMMSICEFYLNDLNENHLIMIKLINFEHFNDKDVNNDSVYSFREIRKVFVIFYKFEFHIKMLIRIDEKEINFDDFRYMIICNEFCEG